MDRAHYRKISPSRMYGHREREQFSESGGFKERLIVQAIVSALVFSVALAACVIESPMSNRAQYGLKRILEGHTTAESVITGLQQFEIPNLFNRTTALYEPLTADELKSPVPELSVIPEP